MRKLLLALTLFTAPAVAQTEKQTLNDEYCMIAGLIAKEIMTMRQMGTPMQALLEQKSDNPVIANMTRRIVMKAYDLPRFESKTHQEKAINDYTNNVQLGCMKALAK